MLRYILIKSYQWMFYAQWIPHTSILQTFKCISHALTLVSNLKPCTVAVDTCMHAQCKKITKLL